MTSLQLLIVYSSLSGSTVFLGALLSHYFGEHVKSGLVKSEIIHSSIAFGGGILLAAVGLVLIPEGMKTLSILPMVLFFLTGAAVFFFIDRFVAKNGSSIAQLLGLLLDFIPESIAMGAVFTHNYPLAVLLALIIAVQNFPESFNAYLDLKVKYSARTCLVILFIISFSGVFSALAGYYLLSDMPMIIGALMLFASGGIIYLIFQDIAPLSRIKKNWIPALGACLGFLIGMIGVKLIM